MFILHGYFIQCKNIFFFFFFFFYVQDNFCAFFVQLKHLSPGLHQMPVNDMQPPPVTYILFLISSCSLKLIFKTENTKKRIPTSNEVTVGKRDVPIRTRKVKSLLLYLQLYFSFVPTNDGCLLLVKQGIKFHRHLPQQLSFHNPTETNSKNPTENRRNVSSTENYGLEQDVCMYVCM